MTTERISSLPAFLYGTAWKEERTAALVGTGAARGVSRDRYRQPAPALLGSRRGRRLGAAYRAGIVARADLFLQTKFTYQRGQDHRLPYDPAASLTVQVAQSMASSLEHLGTDYVDSYVLHGPADFEWSEADGEVWEAMRKERDAGRTRLLGVSNVSLRHLQQMEAAGAELPAFVQNRCFARLGWDREVRTFCNQRKITYQGFSLLTANPEVIAHPPLIELAAELKATPAQVIFSFARAVGMLPLTGTSSAEHMKQDLASVKLELPSERGAGNRGYRWIASRLRKQSNEFPQPDDTRYFYPSVATPDVTSLYTRYQTATTMMAVERFTLLVEA